MKLKHVAVILFILAIVDDFLSLAFPVSFQFKGYSFIPHFAFIGMLLCTYDRPWPDRLLMSCLFGIITDMFFTQSLLVYAFLYSLFGLGAGLLQKYMKEDERIRFFVIFVCVFLIDFVLIEWSRFQGGLIVKFSTWFIHHEFSTLALHILVILALMYCLDVFQRFITIRQYRKQRYERKRYIRLRSHNKSVR